MEATEKLISMEIWHKNYNLDKKDNLNELPTDKTVFAIFGIVDQKPVNCRYVGEAENLKDAIKNLFENPEGEGIKKFMQGPWIQMLQYELMPDSSEEKRRQVVEEWTKKYEPKIDDNGEYPGYYR